MERLLSALFLMAMFCGQSLAAVKYYGQTTAGSADGSSAANCYSLSQLNAGSPYMPAADDVIHFTAQTGDLTTRVVIPSSGTSGHPITYLFDSGAQFSKGNWNQSGAGSSYNALDNAIYATGKDNITIDGQGVGIIECTSNGTGLATSLICNGVVFQGSFNNITVKNLIVRNLYVRTQGPENNYFGSSIYFKNDSGTASKAVIDNCTLSDAGQPASFDYTSATNFELKNSVISACAIGSNIGSTGAGAILTGLLVHDNHISMGLNWSGQPLIHKNCVHLYADASHTGAQLNGLKVYNNVFDGDMGDNSTSYCFLEGLVYSPIIYCNLFNPPNSNYTGNGYMTLKGTQDAVVGNNTFIGVSNAGTAIGTTGAGVLGTGTVIKNNVLVTVGTQISDQTPSISSSDNNVFYLGDANGFNSAVSPGFRNLASWQSTFSFDLSSSTSTPNLSGVFIPSPTSSAIGNGADMSAFYTLDAAGRTWSANSGWGMGWKQYAGASGSGGSEFIGSVTLKGSVVLH